MDAQKAAMAALDRRNPSLDDFVGLNWSCWVDGVDILPSDGCSDSEGSSKYERACSDSMTLMKEDMHIYGHCPAHDEIYLVVCSHCGKVVKPQAFERHCERRHALLLNMCSTASSPSSQQQPRPSSSLFVCRKKQKDGRDHKDSGSSPAALTVHHHRLAQDTASFSAIEKSPPKNPPPHPLQSSSTPHPTVPSLHSGPLPQGQCSSSSSLPERPAAQKPTAGQPSRSQSPQRGMRTYGRVYKNISEKECELNKHCGALDPKRKKLCSRELSCNSDFTVQQQQKTSGRAKTFDQLAAEQRADSTEQNVEQLPVKTKEDKQDLEGKIKSQDSKHNFNSSCHILRSRGPSKSFTEEEVDSTVEVEVRSPYPFNQTLLSSDDDEVDDQDEAENLPATMHHPKPLGLCTFGCRTYGCSIFTFDRRWHHLRFAFSTMLENHDSAHMWKKRPQVPKGLRSNHHTPIRGGSTVKTGARFPKSAHTLSLGSVSPGHLETKTSQNYAHINKLSPSSPTVRPSPGQACSSPVRQTSRSQLKEVELPLDVNSEDKSFTHNRDPIHNERCQSNTPLCRRPVNGLFSYRQKPCAPQLKDVDCDQTGQAQKRKGRNESISHSSSVSRNSKYKCLSPSKLLAWK